MSDSFSPRSRSFDSLPAHAGIGLKPQHFDDVLEGRPQARWFEVHPENYLMDGGPMLQGLQSVRERYPLSFHCIGLSLGSAEGPDLAHARRIASLAARFEPAIVSDHLSWSRWGEWCLNDLLPMPYTQEALDLMVRNVDQVQNLLGRSIAVENPSSYLIPGDPEMTEWEFLVELARRSGSGILLDINNIYVSACNHGWSAEEYVSCIPPELVSEIHLAGHKREEVNGQVVLIDDHGSVVSEPVWELFALALQRVGAVPTLIEWDTNIPEFPILDQQAARINRSLVPVARGDTTRQAAAFSVKPQPETDCRAAES